MNLQESTTSPLGIRLLDRGIIFVNKIVQLEVTLEDQVLVHSFYIFGQMKHPVLLGLDFLRISKLTIDFSRNEESPFTQTEALEDEIPPMIDVKINTDLILKPNESYRFQELLFLNYTEFIPNPLTQQKYRLILKFNGDDYDVTLINIHNYPIHLRKGTVLGWFLENSSEREQNDLEFKEFICNFAEVPKNHKNVIDNLKIGQKDHRLMKLLEKYSHLFAEDLSQLRRANNISHTIDTGDHPPIRQIPYKTSYKEKEIIAKEINKMLDNGIIQESHSPWSSPVVLVTKKDGSVRFCIDYRKLNAVTKKDSGPLPLISDTLDALNNSKIFTKLDLKSGYWAIKMDKDSQEKTAFASYMGLHEFKVMPFGLSNAPANFQRYLQKVLNEYLWQFCLVYIDDVICFSSSMEEHLVHLEKIFTRLNEYNLRLNPEKCEFATEEIAYLGHVVSSNGIKPDPDKTLAVEEFPRPKRLKQVRGFLGLTSYYRKFVKDYSKIAKPLTSLLKKNKPFEWDESCEKTFQELKRILINPPILAHFKPGLPIILYTDASKYAVGAILCQIQDGKERVISYNSKSLDETQINYTVSEKECLAIIYAFQKLRQYLHGAKFVVKTDNCALCFLMKIKDPNGRLVRWALKLQAFDFTIEFRTGLSQKHVDCLSRNPVEPPDKDLDERDVLLLEILNIAEEQKKDPWCSQIIKEIELKRNRKYLSGYKIEDGILYRNVYKANDEQKLLLCVPKSLRLRVMQELHNTQLAGHLGFLKTYVRVRERFFWNRIEKTVRDYVKKCESCQQRKPDIGLPKGNMQPIAYPDGPFELVSMDIVGRLVATPRRNQYIIVLIDAYSKYMEASALKNTRSETIADFFVNQVITRHGAVVKVLTDRAPSFCSEFIQAVYKLTRAQHITTTAYHPSTNGLVERSIRSIRSMMSHYINETHNNWDVYLNKLVFAYNTSQQTTTGETPFKLLYGRECRLPVDIAFDLPKDNRFGLKYKEALEECKEIVRFRVQDAQQRQKDEYDKRHFNVLFNKGDLVGLHVSRREVGMSQKLFKSFDGPFRILRKQGPVNYEVQSIEHPRRKPKLVHIQRLKRWHTGRIEGIEEIRPPVHLQLTEQSQNQKKSEKSKTEKDENEKSKSQIEAPAKEIVVNDDSQHLPKPELSTNSGNSAGDDHRLPEFDDKTETAQRPNEGQKDKMRKWKKGKSNVKRGQ
jgi:transposase InsO family protein